MVNLRRVAFAALVLTVALPFAAKASTPSVGFSVAYDESNDAPAAHAKDKGVVAGEVVEIDYGRDIIRLHTQRRGTLEIVVSPSTSILGRDNDYGTISDITHGSRLSVFISEVDGHLVAQIIHIL